MRVLGVPEAGEPHSLSCSGVQCMDTGFLLARARVPIHFSVSPTKSKSPRNKYNSLKDR